MGWAASASSTCRARASASEWIAAVRSPSALQLRMMRQAISPRLAMSTVRIGRPVPSLSVEIGRDGVANGLGDLDRAGRIGMHADAVGAHGDVVSVDGLDLLLGDGPKRPLGSELGVPGVVLAGDDEAAVLVIVEIDIELREEGEAAP